MKVLKEAYFAIIDEARRREIPVDGHIPFRLTPEEADQMLSDTARLRLVPEAVSRSRAHWFDSEATRELQSILRPIPLELENVRLANNAGVVLLAATDVDIPMGVPGLSLHEELVRLIEAGLTGLEALQAATLNPARVLGLADSLGRIEPGKLADLVLLDAIARRKHPQHAEDRCGRRRWPALPARRPRPAAGRGRGIESQAREAREGVKGAA
jgi:hypothetical protein